MMYSHVNFLRVALSFMTKSYVVNLEEGGGRGGGKA